MAINLHLTCWRFGNNDGTGEANHTFLAAENAAASLQLDTTYILRLGIQQVEATATANLAQQFQCRQNGGSWQNITTTSTIVKAVTGVFANNASSTQRLTTLTGSRDTSNQNCTTDGSSGGTANDVPASGHSETVLSFQVLSANVAPGDTIDFRVTVSGPTTTITYDVTPTATIPASATPVIAELSDANEIYSDELAGVVGHCACLPCP